MQARKLVSGEHDAQEDDDRDGERRSADEQQRTLDSLASACSRTARRVTRGSVLSRQRALGEGGIKCVSISSFAEGRRMA